MKVKELIEILSKLDQDKEILHDYGGTYCIMPDTIEEEDGKYIL